MMDEEKSAEVEEVQQQQQLQADFLPPPYSLPQHEATAAAAAAASPAGDLTSTTIHIIHLIPSQRFIHFICCILYSSSFVLPYETMYHTEKQYAIKLDTIWMYLICRITTLDPIGLWRTIMCP